MTGFFEQGTKVHIATHIEVATIFFLECSNQSVVAFIAEFTIFVAAAWAAHSWSVNHNDEN